MTNQQVEENMLSTGPAAASIHGEEASEARVRRKSTTPDLHRCITECSEGSDPKDKSCDEVKSLVQSPAADRVPDTTMSPQHRQVLAHLYQSSRRSRNCRSVPSSYAQGNTKKFEIEGVSVSVHRVESFQDESVSNASDVDWSFDVASLADDDCSSISSFDGDESSMDDDIFRIKPDYCSGREPISSDALLASVDGRSCKRLRTE